MVFENTLKFSTPFWGSYNHFQALEAIFFNSLGLIYAYSNMNIPLDIKIKKIVAAPSSGRILQLRKNHCAIRFILYFDQDLYAPAFFSSLAFPSACLLYTSPSPRD